MVAPLEYELQGARAALKAQKLALSVSFLSIGVGTKHSPQVLRKFLNKYPEWDHIFVAGLCGAVSGDLKTGEWLSPLSVSNGRETITLASGARAAKRVKFFTSHKILKPAEKRSLLNHGSGYQAVDMESFDLIRLLESKRVPYSVLRVVLDEADFVFPDFGIIFSEKKMNGFGFLLTLLLHPLKAPLLVQYKVLLKKTLKELTQLTILSLKNYENL